MVQKKFSNFSHNPLPITYITKLQANYSYFTPMAGPDGNEVGSSFVILVMGKWLLTEVHLFLVAELF